MIRPHEEPVAALPERPAADAATDTGAGVADDMSADEAPDRGEGRAINCPEQNEPPEGLIPPPEPPGGSSPTDFPRTRINPRNLSLGVLALLAVAYTLYFAKAILLPVTLALVVALLFRPVIRRTRRWRIPAPVASAGVIFFVLSLLVLALYHVVPPATRFVEQLPQTIEAADQKIQTLVTPLAGIDRALREGERRASGLTERRRENGERQRAAARNDDRPDAAPRVRVESGEAEPVDEDGDGDAEAIVVRTTGQTTLTDWLLSTTGSFLAGAVIFLVLLYFLLAVGDDLLNNVLHVLPNFREKRGVVELVRAAEEGMSTYLFTVTVINMCLGIAEGIAMAALGMPTAPLWGVMAFAFNFIPYVGAIAGTAIIFLVAFLSFDSVAYAFVPPLVYWMLTAVEGNFVTPMVLGQRISLNPVLVFLSLAFWGWLWGVGGAVIAVPILAMTKIVCEQFAPLRPVAKLLER